MEGVLRALFVVDRDPNALELVLADLRRRFGKDFAVKGESSSQTALATLKTMAAASVPVALVLVDEHAAELLERVHPLFPHAKRVLLVDRDYSSTSPAVQAIALGHADYHLVRPFADYSAMSEYLSSWAKEQEPTLELFRIVATEGDSRLTQVRDVMTRFSMPYRLYAPETDTGRRLLEQAGVDSSRLPVVIRNDGQVMIDPGMAEIAHAIGVSIKNDVDECQVAIVGAGPAGLTAAVYAASEGLET